MTEAATFFPRIESLRGIACLLVATCHCVITFQSGSSWSYQLNQALLFVFSGSGAVFLFFVLSGFVLELALRRMREKFARKALVFVIRRVLRIYPVVFVVTCVAGIGLHFFFPNRSLPLESEWYSHWYRSPLSLKQFFGSLFLLNTEVNHVVWTLQVELFCSALMPLMHVANAKLSTVWRLVLLIMLIALAWSGVGPLPFGFIYMFYLGTLIPSAIPTGFATLQQSKAACTGLLLLACAGWLAANPDGPYPLDQGRLIYALASFAIIGVVATSNRSDRMLSFLDLPLTRFYGRISYSFYIVHFLCLYVIARLLMFTFPSLQQSSFTPMCLLWAASVAAATGVGTVCYYSVERPFIRLGKHFLKTNYES